MAAYDSIPLQSQDQANNTASPPDGAPEGSGFAPDDINLLIRQILANQRTLADSTWDRKLTGIFATPPGGIQLEGGAADIAGAAALWDWAGWTRVAGSAGSYGQDSQGRYMYYTESAGGGTDHAGYYTTNVVTNRLATGIFRATIRTDATHTNNRYWFGLSDISLANLVGNADYQANSALFRFDTGEGDTKFQCLTNDNTATPSGITDSGVTCSANTTYRLLIDMRTSGSVKFYIATGAVDAKYVLVATRTTRLPVSTTGLKAYAVVRELAASARQIRFSKVQVETL